MKNALIAILSAMVVTLLVLRSQPNKEQVISASEQEQREMDTLSAKQPSDHLEFMGISVDGKLSEFRTKLTKKGFSGSLPDVLRGRFAGEGCQVRILATDGSKWVYGVEVAFQVIDKWSPLLNAYTSWKNLYAEKYGAPIKERCSFSEYVSDSDILKMGALNNGKCNYNALFRADKGSVELSIVKAGFHEGRIVVVYKDRLNKERAKSDVLSDI